MTPLILVLCAATTSLIAGGVLLLQVRLLATGKVHIEEGYDGPRHVKRALMALLRLTVKRSVMLRKLFFQHVLHTGVRFLFYVDKFINMMYARSRNFFVKSAVKNKGSVSHFWEYLKVYKKEIDKENKEE